MFRMISSLKFRGRTRRGEALVEILVASLVLALILPAVFQSLSGALRAQEGLRRLDVCRYGAQWWFSRVPRPASVERLRAMPTETPDGTVRFRWEAKEGEHGGLRVTLTVSGGGGDFVQTRVF